MNIEDIMLSEINQTEKNKYCYVITYMLNLKHKIKQPTEYNKKLTHTYREELVATNKEREGGRSKIKVGILQRYK